MCSTYGEYLKLSIFGQSHGAAIGACLDGIPAGLPVDMDALAAFLGRRAPGRNAYSTPRKEADAPEILAGIVDGFTCGAPIAAVIRNTNTRSGDYDNLKDCPRPGHADYTAQIKYGGYQDTAGGGHFSGRLTAPLCIAGGLCKQWLEREGIYICAHIAAIAGIHDRPFDPVDPEIRAIRADFPVLEETQGADVGHGVEAGSNFSLSHGKGVSIGMAIIARSAVNYRLLSPENAEKIENILYAFHLPTRTEQAAKTLAEYALSDKKRAGGTVSLIIPRAIGRCEILPTPVEQLEEFISAGL